jgi:predicted ATPase/class 3 adenylate cyclase
VSLLFSDIEGSTVLLSRLGAEYTEALDTHRRLLREAWAAHDGVELGTEGDSFFVAFPTAEGAVGAAVQAQRSLESHPWPEGERIRVRIGIHTGTPEVHHDDYVGMDVHRAARIAASAHGGQVVLSSVTAELTRDRLPEGVGLQSLGSHRLKDIPNPELLFQLTIAGMPSQFPALKTLGASSSLPVPATRLVGRDDDVEAVCALIDSPEVRLVTLTGPGGAGKTRLAIEVARHLVADFADGVFFVPLSTVTRSDVMWTSIAEVLDVPPRARTPPALLESLAQRSLLFVLDNLEQVAGADQVVADLLQAAPSCAVVASSRRALSVPGEHRYPVLPLGLPDEDATLEAASASGAVQLFVQHARSVQPAFSLTEDNVADVVAICLRLDGLPLAIELCAARARLLSPRNLLLRIDDALDIASTSWQVPGRQRSLRDTIGWSYELLSAGQQELFRRLGVFGAGADLEAVAAVTVLPGDDDGGADPLDRVADLADASLVILAEGPGGEPRVAMLETIRRYARAELLLAGETGDVRRAHAGHYLRVAERLEALRVSQHLQARRLAEAELDNFRDALDWTTTQGEGDGDGEAGVAGATGAEDLWLDLRLCASLGWFWYTGGYGAEGRRWFELAIGRARGRPSPDLARSLTGYANILISLGEPERAGDYAAQGLAMAREVGDDEQQAYALGVLGTAQLGLGDLDAASSTLEQNLALHRRIGDPSRLTKALGNLAGIEEERGHYARAEELTHEALGIVERLGDEHEAAVQGQNLANLLAVSGRPEEAEAVAQSLIAPVLRLRSPNLTMAFANTYMNILVRLRRPEPAAHLIGAEEAMRERLSMPNPYQEEEREEAWDRVREDISAYEWERHLKLGHGETVEELLAGLARPSHEVSG